MTHVSNATDVHTSPARGVPSSSVRTAAEDSSVPDASSPEDTGIDGQWFYTREAGVFYLINALNHPAVRALLDDAGAWTELPSGWAWLFRLGETLGLQLDDPVASFFAREVGCDAVQQLRELPELPVADALLPLLARLYAADVWQPELVQVEGRVVHTASHIDVEFPMSAVRLPVRLAGLDINPGWVPWLGRVVTFHYLSSHAGGPA
jgi:hypothetical protein